MDFVFKFQTVYSALFYWCVNVNFAGPWIDKCGRRRAILISSFFFILGSGLCGIVPSLDTMSAGRLLQGFGMSMAVISQCIYMSEIAPKVIGMESNSLHAILWRKKWVDRKIMFNVFSGVNDENESPSYSQTLSDEISILITILISTCIACTAGLICSTDRLIDWLIYVIVWFVSAKCIFRPSFQDKRGFMVGLNELGITIGFILAFICGYILHGVANSW